MSVPLIHRFSLTPLTAVLLSLGLTACGGGGSSNSDSPTTGNDPRVLSGRLSAVAENSLTLAGHTLSRGNATLTYAGSEINVPLQKGMQVQVEAKGNLAQAITLDPLLAGQLQATTDSAWQVNGVKVTPPAGSSLTSGANVLVFGQRDDQGGVQADALTAVDDLANVEVEGQISALTATDFKLGTLNVDYSGVSISDGALEVGLWVEVTGRFDSATPTLFASEIEREDDFDAQDWPEGSEIEGQIHYFNADTGRLELDRQRVVQVTKATRCGDDEAPRACRAADFTPGR
ncbi:MAG: DUF5666 domain-containing protein, partial [Shewanella sp.]